MHIFLEFAIGNDIALIERYICKLSLEGMPIWHPFQRQLTYVPLNRSVYYHVNIHARGACHAHITDSVSIYRLTNVRIISGPLQIHPSFKPFSHVYVHGMQETGPVV